MERVILRCLVALLALAACTRSEKTPRRASGDGFTVALPAGWQAEPVDEDYVFRATRSPGYLQIAILPEEHRDVVRDPARCHAWGAELAESMRGQVTSAALENGTCRARLHAMGTFFLYAQEHAAQVYGAMCAGLPSMETDCNAIVASWLDDPTAKAQRRERRIEIAHESGRPVVRAKTFTMTFPPNWVVTEGAGNALVLASTDEGGILGLTISRDIGVLTRFDCDKLGPLLAEQVRARLIATTLIDTPAGTACRISFGEALVRWMYAVKAPDGVSYMFTCGASKGEPPLAECTDVLASWTFR